MVFSRFLPSPPKFKPQSSKKKGVYPWRCYRTKSVEEPTETPETVQDSAQEDLAQEDAVLEDPAQEDPDQEHSVQEDPAQEDSDREPADAEHSLETEVDFLVHLPLALPPQLANQKVILVPTSLFAALLFCALKVAVGHGVSGEAEIGKFCLEKLNQILQTYAEFGIF